MNTLKFSPCSRNLFRSVLFLLPILLQYSAVEAQQTEKEIYHFLNIPVTIDAAGLGGRTVSAISDNPGLVFGNPALYGQETSRMLFLSYMNYMRSAHSGAAFYGMPVGERGAWGAGIRFLQYGSMQGYDPSGVKTAKFSATDLSVQGTFSYDLSDYVRGGVTLKGIYSHIESYSSFGLGVDVGLSYYNDDVGLSVGAAFTNIGAELKRYDRRREPLDWDFAVGVSQSFAHAPFNLHLIAYGLTPRTFRRDRPDLKKGERFLRHFNAGLEFAPGDRFRLMLGYSPAAAQDMRLRGGNKSGGLSLGAAFSTPSFTIGLSAASYHPSALSLMLNLSTNFGVGNEL